MGLTQRILRSPQGSRRPDRRRLFILGLVVAIATAGGLGAQVDGARHSDPIRGPSGQAGPDPGQPEASADPGARKREAAYLFARAKLLSDTGQFEQALESFERAIELDGTDPYSLIEVAEFHAYLAQIARSQSQQDAHLQQSSEYATRARELAIDNVDVLRSYGQIQLRLVEQQQLDALPLARSAFEALRASTEGDLHALISLGQIYLWSREFKGAAEVLTEAASFHPHHPTIEGLLIDAHLNAGELGAAEKILDGIVARDPSVTDQRLQLAELRSHRGDHRGAVEVLQSGPQTQFVNPRFRRLLARELHLSGNNEEALAVTETLLEEAASRETVRRLRVSIYSALARYEDAIDELEAVIVPDDADQSLQDGIFLARLLERIGRSGEAADKLRSLAESSAEPQALRVKMALVSLLERQGSVGEAAEILSETLEKAPPSAAVNVGRVLVQLLARNDRHDEALALLDRLLAKPESAEVADRLRLQKTALLGAGDEWRKALAAGRELLSSPTEEVRSAAYVQVAEALAELGQLDKALATLRRGEEDLDAPEIFAKRLDLLFSNDRAAEAEALLGELASSDSLEDLLFVAQAHQRAGRYEHAVPVLERLLSQDPTSLQVRFFLGAAYERAGRHEHAVAAFQALLERSPDHAPSLNYLGYMWAEKGENLEEALALIQRAVALEPDSGAYVDSLGWAYYQLGRYQQARQHLEWAVRLVPDDPTILEHLGDLYMRLQDLERARDSYRQALDLGGGDSSDEVRRKLATIDQQGL